TIRMIGTNSTSETSAIQIAMNATIPPAKPANWPGIMVMSDPPFPRPSRTTLCTVRRRRSRAADPRALSTGGGAANRGVPNLGVTPVTEGTAVSSCGARCAANPVDGTPDPPGLRPGARRMLQQSVPGLLGHRHLAGHDHDHGADAHLHGRHRRHDVDHDPDVGHPGPA